jgi:hypothetical protein
MNCKLTMPSEIFTHGADGGDGMKERRWFGAKFAGESGAAFMQTLFAPLFRPATPDLSATPRARIGDAGADACWTASLCRGDGLPPFLLSIHQVAGSRSAMRFEPFDKPAAAETFGQEL